MVEPGIGFALVANGVIFVIVFILIFVYRDEITGFFGNEEETIQEWYGRAISIAQETQETLRIKEPLVDQDKLQREILPLSSRLKNLRRSAPPEIEDEVVQQVHELGMECQKLGMERSITRETIHTEVFVEEWMEELLEDAKELERTCLGCQ